MKVICKYIIFMLFIILIFLILMLKSPFQGRSIKCMYVCIYPIWKLNNLKPSQTNPSFAWPVLQPLRT